jgi:hypothetical protein
MVDMSSERSMSGLAVRCVAVESLRFLTLVLEAVRPTVVALIAGNPKFAKSHTDFCASFFARAPTIVDQALYLMYSAAPAAMYSPMGFVASAVAKASYNGKQPPEESNRYVSILVNELKRVWQRMEALRALADGESSMADGIALPRASMEALWVHISARCSESLLEGFATVRTCSVSGRGLMAMDLTALYRGIRNIHPLDSAIVAAEHPLTPRHGQAYVGAYINAYYEEEEGELLSWIQQHVHEYRYAHFDTLIACGVGRKMKKKKLKGIQDIVASMCRGPGVLSRTP